MKRSNVWIVHLPRYVSCLAAAMVFAAPVAGPELSLWKFWRDHSRWKFGVVSRD